MLGCGAPCDIEHGQRRRLVNRADSSASDPTMLTDTQGWRSSSHGTLFQTARERSAAPAPLAPRGRLPPFPEVKGPSWAVGRGCPSCRPHMKPQPSCLPVTDRGFFFGGERRALERRVSLAHHPHPAGRLKDIGCAQRSCPYRLVSDSNSPGERREDRRPSSRTRPKEAG
jgi:hypothetical protein